MIRRFFIIFCFAFFTTCDDGDILVVDLDFDGELERCENFEDYHLIYDTREDPNESLVLIFPKNDTNNALFTTPTTEGEPVTLDLSSTDVRFVYRTYNRSISDDELCDIIPPNDLTIRENYEAFAGDVEITVTIEDDDNDGVPTEYEGLAGLPDENGIYWDSLDTDNDGIPDYLDEDDDGDNVKTINELDSDNEDGDDDPLTNPLDTDGNGKPDYLDNDDDGDDTLTRYEDANGENGPSDDRVYVNDILVAHYLNPEETTAYIPDIHEDYDAFENEFTRTVTTKIVLKNIDLDILRTQDVDFGTLETVITNYIIPDLD